MANAVVVGSQWGDEGKGKIVDWLSERADVVVRFQGGHNAGHTLVIDGVVYKMSLLPSGVVRKGKLGIIGNGVVVDPWALLAEIDAIAGQGVAVTGFHVAAAQLVVVAVEKQDGDLDLAFGDQANQFLEERFDPEVAGADVDADGDEIRKAGTAEASLDRSHQAAQQRQRDVIHGLVAEVLQGLEGRGLEIGRASCRERV